MAKLLWDLPGERVFETGVSKGVLYPTENGEYSEGVAWNGLVSVSENPTGAEPSPQYADNIKYLNLMSTEEFEATIEAFTYPEEFAICDGSAEAAPGAYIGQQARRAFGLSYTTVVGNDQDSNAGYKIHLVYGALASPSDKTYETINDKPEAITFSWEVTTTPVSVKGYKPTAALIIDSTKVDKSKLEMLEDVLYGSEEESPRLPLPDEVVEIIGKSTEA